MNKEIIIGTLETGHDELREYMKSKYTESISRAGGILKWIAIDSPEIVLEEILKCDGLLLSGGPDIDPSLYHEERIPECQDPNKDRDLLEPLILKAFMETKKPILSICRGIQLTNVTLGGTLYQDITPIQKFKHSDFDNRASFTHPVEIEKDSLLFQITGKENILVNSMHHQAVKDVSSNLHVVAKSPDGFIEALEKKDYPFFLCMQWHPEHMTETDETSRKIFEAFIEACQN